MEAVKRQSGQTTVFFALVLTGLLLMTAVAVEIGRIVYVRGEVGKAADAAALAAATQERDRNAGRKIGVVLTGGNVDTAMFAEVLSDAA